MEGVQTIKGVGPSAAVALGRMGIHTVLDLLLHLPVGVFDWGQVKLVRELQEGDTVAVAVRVKGFTEGGGRRPLTIHCVDSEDSPLDLVFFLGKRDFRHFYLKKFYEGSVHRLQGKVARAKYGSQTTFYMSHPEAVKVDEQSKENVAIEPIYRLTNGLNANKLREFLKDALRNVPADFPDWLDEGFRESKGWPSFAAALHTVHHPASVEDLQATAKARERLAFDELLATQLPTAIRRAREREGALAGGEGAGGSAPLVRAVGGDGHLTGPCMQQLPFQMTDGQKRTVSEIWADMASNQRRMVRLLQGDVGSGKTVCALLAMLRAVESGCQAAMLSPTEILAFQHKQTLEDLCQGLRVRPRAAASGDVEGAGASTVSGEGRPVRIEVLTSSKGRGKARKQLLEELKQGEIDILVGTHALLSDDVVFGDLGLTVIDEEHRFGVKQREKLSNETNVLYMSATPIPRTLLLTNYGDMEVSRLEEAPVRDVRVTTTIFALTSVGQIAERLRNKVLENNGEKVFWVLPCIEDKRTVLADGEEGGVVAGGGAEAGGITSVVHRYQTLVELLGEERVGMVHGRMDADSKLQALREFSEGNTNVLVSTSVIEVGVDVPDATVCIVEHAEYFGLSQLHQLRGRIGRAMASKAAGTDGEPRECYCVLTYDDASPNKEKALKRLMTLKKTTDGFQIAEQDLKLRGPGEVLGSRQSGHHGFRLVDLVKHEALLDEAYQLAKVHATRLVRGEDTPSSERRLKKEDVETLLRLLNAEAPDTAPSGKVATTADKSHSAASSATATATATAKKRSTPRAKVQKMVKTTTTSASSSFSDPPPGWTTVTYGDRWEVISPPPSPEDEADLDVAALLAGKTTPLSNRFSYAAGDSGIPRLSIDLEAEDVTFIIFDTETTGLKAESDRIIQLAAKVLTPSAWGGEDDEAGGGDGEAGLAAGGEPEDGLLFNKYVDPGFWIPAKITEITGINNEFLFRQQAKRFEEVWPEFVRWVNAVRGGKPVVLVAHNAGFDHKMVMFDLRRANLDERTFREETHVIGMMDTLPVFRADDIWSRKSGDGLPAKPNSFRQETLFRYLLNQDLQNAHNAKGDVLGLEALLSHPFVRRKWRGAGSPHVLELGGWGEEVETGGGGAGGPATAVLQREAVASSSSSGLAGTWTGRAATGSPSSSSPSSSSASRGKANLVTRRATGEDRRAT